MRISVVVIVNVDDVVVGVAVVVVVLILIRIIRSVITVQAPVVVVVVLINSHNQVRGHRTGSSRSGVEKHPREINETYQKVVHVYEYHVIAEPRLKSYIRHKKT